MPYPAILRSEARNWVIALRDDPEEAKPPKVRVVDDGGDEDWEALAERVQAELLILAASAKAHEKPASGLLRARWKKLAGGSEEVKVVDFSAFEVEAGPAVHKILPQHEALSDPEFWTWLTLFYGRPIVEWRYGADADFKNYGIGSQGENFIYRLWLRSEIGYDPKQSDPYALSRVGDIDFWRSHVFRQTYTDVPAFTRAFVNFQFPNGPGAKPRLKIAQIRELAKRLKRARTNLMFELMSAEQAAAFIEGEQLKLDATF